MDGCIRLELEDDRNSRVRGSIIVHSSNRNLKSCLTSGTGRNVVVANVEHGVCSVSLIFSTSAHEKRTESGNDLVVGGGRSIVDVNRDGLAVDGRRTGISNALLGSTVGVARARDLVVGVSLQCQSVELTIVLDRNKVVVLAGRIAHRANNLGQVGDHAVILVSIVIVIEGIREGVAISIAVLRLTGVALNEVDRDVAVGIIGRGERVLIVTIQRLAINSSMTTLDNAVLEGNNIEGVVLGIASLTIDLQGAFQSSIVSELDFAGNAVDIALNDPRTVGQGVSALLDRKSVGRERV